MRNWILAAALFLTVSPSWGADPQVTQSTTAPSSLPAQHALVFKLIAQYRNPKLSSDARNLLVQQILALDSGPRELAAAATREFKSDSSAYAARFERSARHFLVARAAKIPDIDQHVADLRQRIMAVVLNDGTTHEAVRNQADPPMKELTGLLNAAPADVLSADPSLQAQRQELLDLLRHRARATELLTPDMRRHLAPLPEPGAYDKQLRDSETQIAGSVTPVSNKDQAVLQNNEELAKDLDPSEARCILLLNNMRVCLGVGALTIDPRLCQAARDHSQEMHDKNYYSHESPTPGLVEPEDRARAAGTTAFAENIYKSPTTAEQAMDGWWHSPGHLKNMLSPHARVGLGRFDVFWTMMLGN